MRSAEFGARTGSRRVGNRRSRARSIWENSGSEVISSLRILRKWFRNLRTDGRQIPQLGIRKFRKTGDLAGDWMAVFLLIVRQYEKAYECNE